MASEIKELEVTLRLRNNRLKERRLALGMTQKQLATAVGVHVASYGGLESMRDAPQCKPHWRCRGRVAVVWREVASKLAGFYGVSLEELFPERLRGLPKNTAVRHVDVLDLPALIDRDVDVDALPAAESQSDGSPFDALSTKELRAAAEQAVTSLSDRERDVIRQRIAGTTHDAIAKVQGRTREAIRRVEDKALHKLRHPSCVKGLRAFIED